MASFTVPCPKSSSALAISGSRRNLFNSRSLLLSLRFQGSTRSQSTGWKVQASLNEVTAQSSGNSIPLPQTKLEVPSFVGNDEPSEELQVPSAVAKESTISAFMTQVADLVKLVDSRDIMELELKHLDCELVIRKKEALPQPRAAAPVYMMQPPGPQTMYPSQPPPTQAVAPAASSTPAPAAPALPAPAKSSHPPLKCPMAGTFYRSPAPGAPPFVKVGDKIQKGQVICIVEAMKLMNDIEATESGTLLEILEEDGKPVSVGTPLFVIAP
ncbi:hypothetical protein GIB67_007212 [Kingdonia uniflora]|uniref:Biotin carboxyl carrier protein of acetyl-CoA carboxylase n=1 Tax=Kingdonia uniflora TaxID=39325 RepID=A0A7J7NWW5_9MAGN|nr:hypothetical protein GIB67_007212 [Kingdonia uniflora]